MEWELETIHNRIPCYVVCDEDEGRYAIRTFDTSGAYFENESELKAWIQQNWKRDDFTEPTGFDHVMLHLKR